MKLLLGIYGSSAFDFFTMQIGRDSPFCGFIGTGLKANDITVIVGGGKTDLPGGTLLLTKSTEYVGLDTNTMLNGPSLPVALWKTLVVQTPDYGVILIGGDVDQHGATNMVLYLATLSDTWQVLPQKMKFGRINHAGSVLVRHHTFNCTEASII
jgi:hypothetical protein